MEDPLPYHQLLEKLRLAESRLARLENRPISGASSDLPFQLILDGAIDLHYMDSLDVCFNCWLPDTTLIFTNKKYRQVFFKPNQPPPTRWLELSPPGERLSILAFYQELSTNPHSISHEDPVLIANGEKRYFFWITSPFMDANGAVAGFQSIGIDITERKVQEKQLHDLQSFQQALLNLVGTVILAGLIDRDGTFQAVSDISTMFGLESGFELQIVGRTIFDIFPHETAQLILQRIESAFVSGEIQEYREQKHGRWVEHIIQPIYDDLNAKVTQVAWAIIDITFQIQNEESLYETELLYRAISESNYDMIFVIRDDLNLAYLNSAISVRLGLPTGALIGQSSQPLLQYFESDTVQKCITQVLQTAQLASLESSLFLPHGTIYVHLAFMPLLDRNDSVHGVLCVARDISDQKNLRDSLIKTNLRLSAMVEERTKELLESRDQLRTLSQQIIFAQEEERLRLSRDLHDDAGQALIGLRLYLESILRDLPDDLELIKPRMVSALSLVNHTVKNLRSLAYNLRPPVLDILGAHIAIRELCQQFASQSGIKVSYTGRNLRGLPDAISISLYRFAQEALTNVAKHANAKKVKVALSLKKRHIILSVQDDGRGIPSFTSQDGLGMVGIQERFHNLGGKLEVTPVQTGGLRVQVSLPWNKPK